MIIAEHLYYGDSLIGKEKKVRRNVRRQKRKMPLYCITSASNSNDLLNIISYYELLQPYYGGYCNPVIYGLASTKEEAYEVVSTMVLDALQVNQLSLEQFELFLRNQK